MVSLIPALGDRCRYPTKQTGGPVKTLATIGIAILTITFTSSLHPVAPVAIGDFPGLDQLIAKSDAIVILRVDQHVGDVFPNPTFYTTHECYVYQTLKGRIPANKKIRLRLMDTRTGSATPFSIFSTHLMFLTKKREASEPTEYRTIEFIGANIRVPDLDNEKAPIGDNAAGQIRSLLSRTQKHNQKKLEAEKALLNKMAK